MRKEIEKLLASDSTSNKIATESGVTPSKIYRLRSGETKLDNITLAVAEKLYEYQRELEMENMMEQIRKELESAEEGYYVEQYEDFYDLLEEREISEDEYYELVNDIDHEVILGTPVVVYENPSTSLFNVVYFDGGDDAEDMILQLQGLA